MSASVWLLTYRLLVIGGFLELASCRPGFAGDLEVAADALADHARTARRLVGARLGQLNDQLALEAGEMFSTSPMTLLSP